MPASDNVNIRSHAACVDARGALTIANQAAAQFEYWSSQSPAERAARLENAAAMLEESRDALTQCMMREIGASENWGHFNVHTAASILRQAATLCTQVTTRVQPADQGVSHSERINLAVRTPAGICLGIAPWNAPIILGIRAIAAPLACGNTCVLKASELCPDTFAMIGELLISSGIAPGVVGVVINSVDDTEEVVEALIAHPAVRRISFTGSTRVGRQVAQISATHLKRCLLELGGNAPLIILPDADIKLAVDAAVFGAFANQGQVCMSTERVIVDESIADEFADQLIAAVERQCNVSGSTPSSDVATGFGSVISEQAAQRLETLVKQAVSEGASLRTGGGARSNQFEATVLDHVTESMKIYRLECFGPVISIIRSGSVEESITLANDSEFGLTASVYGRDIAAATAVALRIESGICHVNSPTVADDPHMPFGGMKSSGYGRFGGDAALDEFTELRWLSIGDAAPAPSL